VALNIIYSVDYNLARDGGVMGAVHIMAVRPAMHLVKVHVAPRGWSRQGGCIQNSACMMICHACIEPLVASTSASPRLPFTLSQRFLSHYVSMSMREKVKKEELESVEVVPRAVRN